MQCTRRRGFARSVLPSGGAQSAHGRGDSNVASAGCVFRSSQLMRPIAYMDRWGVKPESGPINDAAHAAAGPQAGSPPPRLAATVAEEEDTVSATHERAAARGCALSTADEVHSSKRKPS